MPAIIFLTVFKLNSIVFKSLSKTVIHAISYLLNSFVPVSFCFCFLLFKQNSDQSESVEIKIPLCQIDHVVKLASVANGAKFVSILSLELIA